MTTLLVPCRPGSTGPLAARDAYMADAAFRDWRRYAEASGLDWYVVSTKHGLLSPSDVVPGPYDVRLREALHNERYLNRLKSQIREAGLTPRDLVVIDADWFQQLVATALGAPKHAIALRSGISPRFAQRMRAPHWSASVEDSKEGP